MGVVLEDQFTWTDAAVAKLRTLWLKGPSCAEIARLLRAPNGKCPSRSAVIGKARRLGLSGRARAAPPGRVALKPAARPVMRAPKTVAAPVPAIERKVDCRPMRSILPLCEPVRFEDVGSGCKYPVEEGADGHLFCGAPPKEGKPYCAGHCSIAYSSERMNDSKRREAATLYRARRAA